MMLRTTCSRILRCSSLTSIFNKNCRRHLQNSLRTSIHSELPIRLNSSATNLSSKINPQALGLHVDKSNEVIKLNFEDAPDGRFPFVWLRDNCLCSDCHEKSSVQRILLLENLDIDIYPLAAVMDTDCQSMGVHWSDGHRSEYPLDWLKKFKFPASTNRFDGLEEKYWGSEMTSDDKILRYSFYDIMSDDSCLYSWLGSLHTYGFSIVNNMGHDDTNVMKLAKRVAYPRRVCYGEDFIVKSDPEPTNLAYTGFRLCLHTDLPYYNYEPGIQILHCIQKSEHGGSSEFADGFKVAYDLQRDDPETFEILSTVPIKFDDQGIDEISNSKYFLTDWKPIVRLDRSGRIQQINFNNHVRGIQMSVAPEKVKTTYRALAVFNSALYKKDNFISLKLQEGEAACFNNTRVLHGRSAFTVPPGCKTPRHLQGLFVDWDEIYARMRAIAPAGMN